MGEIPFIFRRLEYGAVMNETGAVEQDMRVRLFDPGGD